VGWQVLEGVREKLVALFLEDAGDHPRIRRRSEIVRRVIEEKNVATLLVPSQGASFLTRLLYLVYLGDLASYYLALLNGVNPKPVAVIDFLKTELVRS
jgi:glucose/mannose-6-phosphate isomerase